MSLKIYLLRHDETTYSRQGTFCGSLDAELTQEGTQMADAFADAYRMIPWTDVYVSPMQRAIATAQPLCQALGLVMQLRAGLKEILRRMGRSNAGLCPATLRTGLSALANRPCLESANRRRNRDPDCCACAGGDY